MHGIKRTHLSKDAKLRKLEKDKVKIKTYRSLQDDVLDLKDSLVFDQMALDKTTKLLDLNPEFYTIWNYRRDILINYVLKDKSLEDLKKIISDELLFTMTQLKKFPKCYCIWNHRVWMLSYDKKISNWDIELMTVSKMLDLDSRNFHGWHYRRFIISSMESLIDKDDLYSLVLINLKELSYTSKMINRNISNYSAWHNRSKLVVKLFEQLLNADYTNILQRLEQEKIQNNNNNNIIDEYINNFKLFENLKNFINLEIDLLINAIFTDAEDSSVWVYMRWVLSSKFFYDKLSKDEYLQNLNKMLEKVEELNELEKDDNNGQNNPWCIKTTTLIKELIRKNSNTL
ncbi:hypothetical protein PACTADRAFT_49274 [Pachysolen tannophilus NRRL Y-2460]|uniref:Geranylgeranyl transferase type-2 subunit alpha n=1 Tax=Pachysolen tannophilus NRRL Y-2460 TaxID=669874 RepID=A0A1E4TVR8_PACTA|nr:hypothetical protein PACTADRAFT_49274 [Pachysolen tannophilus NRRL Y-2460]